MSRTIAVLITGLVLRLHPVAAQEAHEHADDGDHHHGLHFSHPLFTESISPDTKVRADVGQGWADAETESELSVEAEYAFAPAISVHVEVPYVVRRPEGASATSRVGTVEVVLKAANFAFAEHGFLLGYGMGVGLPTGDQAVEIGSDHLWELGPFLDLGFARGPVELLGFSTFEIPINQQDGEAVETGLRYDVSGLYHVTDRVEGLVELNGDLQLSGAEAGAGVLRVSPGIKVAPLATRAVFFGVGLSLPIHEAESDTELRVSAFYHF